MGWGIHQPKSMSWWSDFLRKSLSFRTTHTTHGAGESRRRRAQWPQLSQQQKIGGESNRWWLKIGIHPGRLTWNLRIHPWKRKIIFQTIIFRFYVNLPGCKLISHRCVNLWDCSTKRTAEPFFHETSDLSSAFVAQTVQKPLLCLETSICWDWTCCLSWHVWHRDDFDWVCVPHLCREGRAPCHGVSIL